MPMTSKEIEELSAAMSNQHHIRARTQCGTGLNEWGAGLTTLDSIKVLLDKGNADLLLTDAQQIVYNDWELNLRQDVLAILDYKSKTSVDALAQLVRDFSIQGGVEGGANELRLYVGGVEHPTDP